MRLFFLLLIIPSLAFSQIESKKFYYPNGELSSEGIIENGKPNGYWKTYSEEGIIKSEGNRKNYLLDSIWKFYDDKGLISKTITYKKGKKNGFETSYLNGFKNESINYSNGYKDGLVLRFSLDSIQRIIYEGLNQNDKRNGLAYSFADDGRITSIEEYKNGALIKSRKINFLDSNLKKQGSWVWFDSNRKIIKEGFFKDDLEDGYFKYFDKKGNLIKTEKYSMGELVKDAIELAKLDVKKTYYPNNHIKSKKSYRNNIADGIHQEFDESGNSTNTEIFKLGKLIAKGGSIDDKGLKQGEWTEFHENGNVKSKGNYKNGLKDGVWQYYYSDSSLEQKGAYRDGKSDGVWRWYYKSGNILREETFIMGKEYGEFVEYSDEGSLIVSGEFEDGKKQGKWFYLNENIKTEGEYDYGQKVGKWIDINILNEQIIKESNYYEGLLDGDYKVYSENGDLLMEGKYENDLKQGVWNYYNSQGANKVTIKYKDGVDVKYDDTETIIVE